MMSSLENRADAGSFPDLIECGCMGKACFNSPISNSHLMLHHK